MNALHGIEGFRTRQVEGIIKKQRLPILIDTGSIHNFISEDWTKCLSCKLIHVVKCHVSITNGNQMKVQYVCKGIILEFQGIEFLMDFLVPSTIGYGTIRGIQWLSTLGNIYKTLKLWRCHFNIMALMFL